MSPLTKYDTIAPNIEINKSVLYMPILGAKIVLIEQECMSYEQLKTKDEFCSNTRFAFQ